MLSCPLCPSTYLDHQKSTFSTHTSSLHRLRYWVLEKKTGNVLFVIRRETPTSSLQCPSCAYSTRDSRSLWGHLPTHDLPDFITTLRLNRALAISSASKGVKLDRNGDVKDVISIDSDDDSDIVFVNPKKPQPTSADGATTAAGTSQQKRDSSTSSAAGPSLSRSQPEVPALNSIGGILIAKSKASRPHHKPFHGTVTKIGSSSQKREPDVDVPIAPPAKRRLIQASAPERPPNSESIVRDPSVRKTEAMDRVQRLETGLSDRCVVALIDLFQQDVSAADAYLALTREGVRKQWIADRVRHIRDGKDEVL